jgi:hypothetical protein
MSRGIQRSLLLSATYAEIGRRMRLRLHAILGLCLTARVLPAQLASPGRALDGTIFVDFIERRDATISPLRYGGNASGARLGYVSRGTRYQRELAFELHGGSLSSSRSEGGEQLGSGDLSFAVLRSTSANAFVGLALHADALVTEHQYGEQMAETFLTSAVTLSPIADWIPAHWNRRVRARAWIPVLAYVAHPYSRAKALEGSVFTLVGPSRWRAVSFELTRTSNDTRRVAWVAAYRLDVRSYREDQGLASVESRILVSALVRLGRIAR